MSQRTPIEEIARVVMAVVVSHNGIKPYVATENAITTAKDILETLKEFDSEVFKNMNTFVTTDMFKSFIEELERQGP